MRVCRKCGAGDSAVVNSRPHGDGIRRRRQCGSCGHRWSTLEVEKLDEAELVDLIGEMREITVAVQSCAGALQKLVTRVKSLESEIYEKVPDRAEEKTPEVALRG